jgi:hypothetical protein
MLNSVVAAPGETVASMGIADRPEAMALAHRGLTGASWRALDAARRKQKGHHHPARENAYEDYVEEPGSRFSMLYGFLRESLTAKFPWYRSTSRAGSGS